MNAPDLYIPLMSFVTYILLSGYVHGTSGHFNPDVIGNVGTYCLVLQSFEIGLITFALYLLQASCPLLDLVAYTGYKYVR